MTIAEKLKTLLENNGLWPDEAAAVVEQLKTAEHQESMQGRWNDDVSDYPAPMLSVLWMACKQEAVAYLEQKNTSHFALPFLKQ